MKAPFCYFSVPDDDMTHSKLEGSVVEGMYWKRGMPAVCAQYKRWRNYSRSRKAHEKPSTSTTKRKRNLSGPSTFEDTSANKMMRCLTPPIYSSSMDFDEFDDLENVFTDSLFDSLNQPYMFPDREMGTSEFYAVMNGNADIMQPGLLPLQPSLEEIMASLEEVEQEPERCSPRLAAQATEHVPGPSSIPTQVPPTVMAPPPMAPAPRMAALAQTAARPAQDYAVANMLVDYSNQPLSTVAAMPTRQPSSITSQMLMLSAQSFQPQYSTALYDNRAFKPLFGDTSASTSGIDYLPQYLQTQSGVAAGSQHIVSSITSTMRQSSWWGADNQIMAQSPLSVSAMTPLGGQTPLAPSPLVALGPSTPPTFRTELRSPVVRSTNDINTHDMLKTTDCGIKSTLTHRLEQPSLLAPKLDYKAPEWGRPTSSTSMYTEQQGQRSAPNSAPVRGPDADVPWKFATLQPPTAPVYPNFGIASSSSMDDTPPTSSEGEMCNMDTLIMKEEPQLMSAPPSVKPPRSSGSRQVPADSTLHPEERKRILHLHAEQNRRSALKDGFDQLMELIPNLYSGGVKPTNAVVLAKSGEHIRRQLNAKLEQQKMKEELMTKINRLQKKINSVQASLPTTSGLMSGKVEPKLALENFHDGYVKDRSKMDWRYWVMARLLQPLTVGQNNSFAAAMAGDASAEELAANASDWLNKRWRGPELRPLASTLLVHLATNTNVLSNPESLEDYVKEQVKKAV